MLIACRVKKNKANKIPAVVHVDNSCRVQSVSKTSNSKFWKLINEFGKLTNIPVVLNTSFNVKGEPIVNDCNNKCFKIQHRFFSNRNKFNREIEKITSYC